jgi:PAS domain S-box-containing protein
VNSPRTDGERSGYLSVETRERKQMEKGSIISRKKAGILSGAGVLLTLYATSRVDYLLFHSLAELFSIVVAFGIFMITWNARRFLDNSYLLFLGISFLFTGSLDLLHTLAYKGMHVFRSDDANLATQLWIAARYVQSLSFLIAPLFLGRRLKPVPAFVGFSAVTAFLLAAIFYWGIFPKCFVEGIGLTPFKKISEYLICLILLAAGGLLYGERRHLDWDVLRLILISIALTISAELAFTFYISVYGLSNLIGHFLKILAFYFVYKALIEKALVSPYSLLFRDLKRSEEALRESEERYRLLFNEMISGFALHRIILDEAGEPKDYVFLNVNPAFERLTGLKAEEVVGKSVLAVLPETEPHWIKTYGEVALSGKPIHFENYAKELDKHYECFAFCPKKGQFAVTFADVTERKKAERERERLLAENREQRRFLERLMEVIPAGIAAVRGSDYRCEFANPYWKTIPGIRDIPMVGKRLEEVFPDAASRGVLRGLGKVCRSGQPVTVREYPYLAVPTGEQTYWNVDYVPLTAEGEVDGVLIIAVEVTEEVRARKLVEELAARDEAILESMHEALILADPEGNVLRMNLAALTLYGFESAEQAIKHLKDYPKKFEPCTLDGSPIPLEGWPLSKALSGERFTNYEVRLRNTENDKAWIGSYSGTPVFDKEGALVSTVLTIHDITRQKEAERALQRAYDEMEMRVRERTAELEKANEELRLNEERFRRTFDQAPIGAAIVTLDYRFERVNDALCHMTGYSKEELTSMSFIDITHPEDLESDLEDARRLGAGQIEQYEMEKRYIRKDGKIVWVNLHARLIRDRNGEPLYFLPMIDDISKRKRAEAELKLYTKQLEWSNRELQDFAFVASHDLQEPLRKIQAFGDLLKKEYGEALDEQGADYLERMQNAAGRMQALIQDLLTYSRVTTKASPFAPVDLKNLAEEVIADLEARILETGGRVEVGDLDRIEADPHQMRQLLQNLLGNALKFHGDKSPLVAVYGRLAETPANRGRASNRSRYEILVEDNGIGFDEKYLDRIFTPFQRLHGRSDYEGTGMGLAICRKIVERHGGSIAASSRPGKGSIFKVTLPLRQDAKERLS